ncbi:MAG: iron ABC transporter permease [Oligoflexia bacterium]|nr:iron ABC transporter permease [Oligoflexia bacterium]
MARRLVLGSVVVVLLIIGLAPLISMITASLLVDGHFTFSAYRGLLGSAHQWTLMGHSLLLSTLVTVFAVGLGVPLGLLLGRTDLYLRRLLTLGFVLPLLLPPYVLAVAWFDASGPDGLLGGLGTDWLFGLGACVLIIGTLTLPIPMLLCMVAARGIDPRLEEAGRLHCGWPGVLRGITVPLVRPAVLLAALLVFLLALGEFSVPGYLRYDVFPVEAFTRFSAFYDFQGATAATVPLALIVALLLLIERFSLRERSWRLVVAPAQVSALRIPLGPGRLPLSIIVGALASLLVLLPLFALAHRAGGVDAVAEALSMAGGSLGRSLFFAAIAATFLTVLGFLTGYMVQRRALWGWRAIDSLTIFLFALPSTVIGIGLVSLWNTGPTAFIYASPAIIVLGDLARYTALTSRFCAVGLARIPASMEEAAELCGVGWIRRLISIVLPLSRRSLIAAWLVGFLFSLRDTGITMLVYPAGQETLPVRIFTLMANGSPRLVAALCLIMVVATGVPAAILFGIASAHGEAA